MSWYRKQDATPFDALVVPGLFFLDGDVVARELENHWTVDMKYPLIAFPSGITCEVWGGERNERDVIVHLFGEMDLLLFTDQNAGFRQAFAIAEQVGYGVKKHGDRELEVVGYDRDEHLIVTYDNIRSVIVDVKRAAPSDPVAQPLLDEQSRAKLPPLYSGEQMGLEALAQVKFFTPDSNWTWYASEGAPVDANGHFDTDKEKVDFLFFGLVIGYEIELGFFSLSELTDARGPFGLSIERDKFYQPKTLQELRDQHRKERGEQ